MQMSNRCIGSENNLSHSMIEKYIQMEENIEILLKVKKKNKQPQR